MGYNSRTYDEFPPKQQWQPLEVVASLGQLCTLEDLDHFDVEHMELLEACLADLETLGEEWYGHVLLTTSSAHRRQKHILYVLPVHNPKHVQHFHSIHRLCLYEDFSQAFVETFTNCN